MAVVQVVEQDGDGHEDRRRQNLEATYTTTDSGSAPDESGDDRGKYLHAKATYTDSEGIQQDRELSYRITLCRAIRIAATRCLHVLLDRHQQKGDGEQSRRNVGAPVTATDADNDRAELLDG